MNLQPVQLYRSPHPKGKSALGVQYSVAAILKYSVILLLDVYSLSEVILDKGLNQGYGAQIQWQSHLALPPWDGIVVIPNPNQHLPSPPLSLSAT